MRYLSYIMGRFVKDLAVGIGCESGIILAAIALGEY